MWPHPHFPAPTLLLSPPPPRLTAGSFLLPSPCCSLNSNALSLPPFFSTCELYSTLKTFPIQVKWSLAPAPEPLRTPLSTAPYHLAPQFCVHSQLPNNRDCVSPSRERLCLISLSAPPNLTNSASFRVCPPAGPQEMFEE